MAETKREKKKNSMNVYKLMHTSCLLVIDILNRSTYQVRRNQHMFSHHVTSEN